MHCYRPHIPGSEKPYFWESSVEMVLGLYQSPPRIPVFLVLASKQFTAGSGRTGSPHRKDFTDIQSLRRTVSFSVKGNTYICPWPQHHTHYSSKTDRISRAHMTMSICSGIIRTTYRREASEGEIPPVHSFSLGRTYLCLKVKQAANTP